VNSTYRKAAGRERYSKLLRVRSSTCWFAGYSAWPSWYSARTWRRMLNCWCSGTRTRFCAATSAGSGTSQQTECGSPRWHGSSPAGGGPKSSRLRPRHCWRGTANCQGESTTRADGESPAVRQQSQASPAWSFGWRRRIRCGDTAGSTANWRNWASPWRRPPCGRSCMLRASILRRVAQARHPTGEWTVQQARNLALALGERFEDIRFLLRDGGSNFTASFDAVFQATGTRIVRTAVQASRMNATCERLVGTLRRELLDRVLILGEQHLRAVLTEYQAHYNTARPHQGIAQCVPRRRT
jgi:hypothetical protein